MTPLDGLLGLIRYIPVIGKRCQDLITRALLKKAEFISLPNIMAKQILAPQIIRELSPSDCAEETLALFNSDEALLNIKDKLSIYKADTIIDSSICDYILNYSDV